MIVGVSFEIPQIATNILWNILSAIDIHKYFWYCDRSQTEVWDKTFENDFFTQEYYDGEYFSKCVKNSHRIVFLKLQAYTTLQQFKSIHTYDEFINSDCPMLMLIYDCENVEIYVKNSADVNAVFERAKNNGYQNVAFITDDNVTRKVMDIM